MYGSYGLMNLHLSDKTIKHLEKTPFSCIMIDDAFFENDSDAKDTLLTHESEYQI